LRWFGDLHPTKEFPHRGLLLFGIGSIIASFFPLQEVILALMAARIVIQFNAQVIALFLIRASRPDIHRPFRVWLYPLTPLVSLAGYLYVFASLGLKFIFFGLLTLVIGAVVYLLVARQQREWPFQRHA
jgi:amino acid transporter